MSYMMKKNNTSDLDAISIVENCLSLKFPKPYRAFLQNTNGGVPEKTYFTYNKNSDDGSIINVFFGIANDKNLDIVKFYKEYRDVIPKGMIPIGDDQGGNPILLCVNGENYGNVYFLDHERPLVLVAESFDEFINGLKSEEEIIS